MKVRGERAVIIGTNGEGEEVRSPPLPYIEVSEEEGLALIGTGVASKYHGEEAPADDEALRLAAEIEAKRLQDEAEEQKRLDDAAEAERLAALPGAPDPSPPATEVEAEIVEDVQAAEAENALRAEAEAENAEIDAAHTTPAADAPSERQVSISEVFEILEADDLVKTGARAGRPKVTAIEAATGFDDVTVAEVDALWAARDA